MSFFSKWFGRKSFDYCAPQINEQGDVFYPRDLFYLRHNRVRTDYDMRNAHDRELARMVCTPLAAVLSKLGDMLSRSEVYVTDADGNEPKAFDSVRELLMKPNPLQSFSAFFKQVEGELRLHGFCLVKLVRPLPNDTPRAMWVAPSEFVKIYGTGKVWEQFETDGVISRVVLNWITDVELAPWEYVIITDGNLFLPREKDGLLNYYPASATLSYPVCNWIAAMAASHTLLVNGGPKGIIHGEGTDNFGQSAVSKPDEEEIREQFKKKYGLVGQKYPVLVTRHALRWQPMDYNAAQLRIDENDDRCTAKICNTLGLNPNLFTDAKYDNQESAKKAAYQDVVIPDSLRIAEALSAALLPDGVHIVFDYSAVECLQASKHDEAQTLNTAADAMGKLLAGGLISPLEARGQLAKYMDINPAELPAENNNDNGTE